MNSIDIDDYSGWTFKMTAVHPFFVSTGVSSTELPSSVKLQPRTARLRRIEVVGEQEISPTDSLTDFPLSDIESCNDAADRKCIADDLRFPDEEFAEVGALKTNITPFLRFMMFNGVYFCPNSGIGESVQKGDGEEQHSSTAEKSLGVSKKSTNGSRRRALLWKCQKIYTIAVTTYLWLTAIRTLTIFNSNDSFNSILFYKLSNLAWIFQVAVSQTSMVVACQSGRLESILSDIRITVEFAKFVRKRTISSIVVSLLFLGSLGSYFLYVFISGHNSDVSFKYFLAPFYTYIPVGDQSSIALRTLYLSFGIFIMSGWGLPKALNHLLALIFSRQFRMLYDRFSAAIDPETGRFNGSIRLFRRRHQKLCKAVRHADYFMKIAFFAGFVGHMANVIVSLFALVTIPIADPTSVTGYAFALTVNSVGLCISAIDGVLINSGAHKILELIHRIDVSKLNFYENVELTMFHKRLSGDAVGITILGMFVISNKTLLTVLKLMITYFLLLVKLSKTFNRSSTADSATCILTNQSNLITSD